MAVGAGDARTGVIGVAVGVGTGAGAAVGVGVVAGIAVGTVNLILSLG